MIAGMDPLLAWIMAGLSAFLLITGGFLLARSVGRRRLHQLLERARLLEQRLAEAQSWQGSTPPRSAREEHLAEHVAALDAENARLREALAKGHAQRASVSSRGPSAPPPDDFGGATSLPGPQGYFHPPEQPPVAPGLRRVSEDEYELHAAIPPAVGEPDEFGRDPRDATRQFKLHSHEAVVHFMQRIDELSDENRELRSHLADMELQIQEHRAEGGEQVQRFAALDATADKLREELKRRGNRIRQLEELLEGERLTGVPGRGGVIPPEEPPPIPVDRGNLSRGAPLGQAQAPEDPTLRVGRLNEGDLHTAAPPKTWKRSPGG